jgi:DNA-binding MarR family transcriptional regulator
MTPDAAPHGAGGAQATRICPLLRLAHRRASREFTEALRPLAIEGRHYGVLLSLGLHGSLSQRQLIDRTGSDKSGMVRTVDDLEARGLAVRRPSPADRRAYAVELTETGRALHAEAGRIADSVAARLLDCLSEDEQSTFCALLERFVSADTT